MDRTGTRLRVVTKPGAMEFSPAISPDEKTAAVRINAGTTADIRLQDLERDVISRFTFRPGIHMNPIWSPDGSRVAFSSQTLSNYSNDIYQKPASGSGQEELLLHAGINESGQAQIYVQAIPASGAKYQISTSGGTQPTWRRDGRELFYISTDRKLMAVPITVGTSVTPGTPQPLFAADFTGYTPSADGQRFLVNVPAGGQAAAVSPITVVLNWTTGLQR